MATSENPGEELDLFSFLDAPEADAAVPEKKRPALSLQDYRQLAMGFLWSKGVEAAAMQVPARFRKYQVTAAGFRRGGNYRELESTVIVVLYERFDLCFADCADRDAQLAELHALRAEREKLEAEIRKNEPHLGSTDDLFCEFRSWDYGASANPGYRKLRRRFEKLQHALHQGSRLEHIRRTGVADYCYLAVPEGLVAADEIAAGWGLVYLGADRSFRVVREAEQQTEVTPEGRRILAQNIAVAAAGAVRFAAGVEYSKNGRIAYRKFPRKKAYRR